MKTLVPWFENLFAESENSAPRLEFSACRFHSPGNPSGNFKTG